MRVFLNGHYAADMVYFFMKICKYLSVTVLQRTIAKRKFEMTFLYIFSRPPKMQIVFEFLLILALKKSKKICMTTYTDTHITVQNKMKIIEHCNGLSLRVGSKLTCPWISVIKKQSWADATIVATILQFKLFVLF